ncbi:MAG TPA: hypothetical protein VLA28_02020, partial [Afifellaceae bacterium]|nr:hypothetical protein [Afifellaceae bacterium]
MNEVKQTARLGPVRRRAPTGLGVLAVAAVVLAGAEAAAQSMPSHGKDGMGDMGDMMRPDAAAPTGVVGGMNPKAGKLMPSITYMHMGMDGNRNGTDDVST